MYSNYDLKNLAKERISGLIGSFFLVNLVYAVMYFITSYFGGILALPMDYGYRKIHYDLAKHNVEPSVGDLFTGYKELNTSIRFVGLNLLCGLYVFLWSMLLLIPGIVKAYSYAAAPYIFIQDPTKGINQCITESRKLMNGKKMDFFLFHLSFLPNILLLIITFGLYGIYLTPYMNVATALFMTENVMTSLYYSSQPNYSYDNNDEPVYKHSDSSSTTTGFDDDFGSRVKETPKEEVKEEPVENQDKFSSLVDSIKEGLDSSKEDR